MMAKGYATSSSYMGWINQLYISFPTEDEYIECLKESEVETNESD